MVRKKIYFTEIPIFSYLINSEIVGSVNQLSMDFTTNDSTKRSNALKLKWGDNEENGTLTCSCRSI